MYTSVNDLLEHILIEIDYLEKNSIITESEFSQDETLQRAFVRSLEIIGEAVSKIPDEIKLSHSEILWKEISGMRNRLIHDYFGVDYSIVWDTVKNEIPLLKNQILEIRQMN
jgi:uncharacterized protein with HEPN domain